MERPCLNDAAEFPDDAVLARHLGAGKPAWDAFLSLLAGEFPQLSHEWRFYNDGKSWLLKVNRKDKTVCWGAVWDKYFTVACYLSAKADPLVRASSLDPGLKQGFLDSKRGLRAIRVEVRHSRDLDAVRELIGIKLKLK